MSTSTALAFLLSLTGCTVFGPSLEGDWEGEIDCGDGATLDIDLSLERDKGNDYEGDGEIQNWTCYAGDESFPCDVTFDVEITADGGMGEQDLDIDADNCEASYGGETYDSECESDIEDAEWDGEDTIVFEVDGCDGELERD